MAMIYRDASFNQQPKSMKEKTKILSLTNILPVIILSVLMQACATQPTTVASSENNRTTAPESSSDVTPPTIDPNGIPSGLTNGAGGIGVGR